MDRPETHLSAFRFTFKPVEQHQTFFIHSSFQIFREGHSYQEVSCPKQYKKNI